MSAKEMREELRALRKEHPDHRPVSKMRKGDISEMIQKLKAGREETPNVASITNAPAKMYKSVSESIHKAKEEEFPVEISGGEKASPKKKVVASVAVKKAKVDVMPEPKMKAVKKAEPPAKKGGKGSEEMKAKMAAIRAKKGKKE